MTDVLVEFDTILRDERGGRWIPRACARVADDGLWEGLIEFLPTTSSAEPVRTGRETEQHDRGGVLYWAEGLTQIYLEGALNRALRAVPSLRRAEVSATPAFDGPRPSSSRQASPPRPRPVLNPFEVYQQGEDILVSELSALSAGRLRDIVTAYGFASPEAADGAGAAKLSAMIVAGVRRPPSGQRSPEEPRAEPSR
jgi:hypothetical protein